MIPRFLRTAFQDYFSVGGFVPSSKYTSRKVASKLSPHCKNIVEYGGGTGAVTRDLLKKMPDDGKLVVIELQKDFIEELNKIDDKRLTVIHGDVGVHSSELRNLFKDGPDAVVSGLPFLFFNEELRNEIILKTKEGLAPHGRLVIYQHSLQFLSTLKRIFPVVKVDLEVRNFPPYFVMTAFK